MMSTWCTLAGLFAFAATSLPVVRIGSCGFYLDGFPYHMMELVAKIAFEEGFMDYAINQSFVVSFQWIDAGCDTLNAELIVPLLLGQGQQSGRVFSNTSDVPPIVAVVGCACSETSAGASQLTFPFEVPMVSGGATASYLSDKHTYPNFFRVVPSDSKQGNVLGSLVSYFAAKGRWQRMVVICLDKAFSMSIADAFQATMLAKRPDMDVIRKVLKTPQSGHFTYAQAQIQAQQVAALRPQPRIFLYLALLYLCSADRDGFISHAYHDIGLFSSSAAIFTFQDNCDFSIFDCTLCPEDTLEYNLIPGLMCTVPVTEGRLFRSAAFHTFWSNLTYEKLLAAGLRPDLRTPPWLFGDVVPKLDFYSILFFDAMAVLLVAAANLVSGGRPITGRELQAVLKSVDFEGLSGRIVFDSNFDRLAPYSINNLQLAPVLALVEVGTYDTASDKFYFTQDPIFGSGTRDVPADRPAPCEVGTEYIGSVCQACPPGRYGPQIDAACIDCARGYFAATLGLSACTPASSGRYVAEVASAMSTACPPGSFSALPGSSYCEGCHAGFYANSSGSTTCRWCPQGMFADPRQAEGNVVCSSCPDGETTLEVASTSPTACVCTEGRFRRDSQSQCMACPEGMRCPTGSDMTFLLGPSSAPHPVTHVGFMTLPLGDPLKVFACLVKGNCPGGGPGTCALNRDGSTVACGECLEGFYNSGSECSPCGDTSAGHKALPLIVFAVVCICGCAAVALWVSTDPMKQTLRGQLCTLVLSLLLTGTQTLAVFDRLSITWFEPAATIFNSMRIISFDLMFLKVSCTIDGNPVLHFAGRHVTRLICVFIICATLVGKKRFLDRGMSLALEGVHAIGALINALFISILESCVLPMVCYPHPAHSGQSMRATPSILCFQGGAHTAMLVVGCLALAALPLPFAALTTYGIWKYPQLTVGTAGTGQLQALRFLFVKFAPERYYYGGLLLVRSVLICFVPVSVSDPDLQTMLLWATLCLGLALQAWLRPWRSNVMNVTDAVLVITLVLLLGCGSMAAGLKASSYAAIVFGTLALSLFFAVGLAALGVSLWYCLLAKRPYDAFICHHKADAAAQARFLKVLLQARAGYRVYIDSDDTKDLDVLFDAVKTQVKHLIVYLTRDTLRRPWCGGEITSAVQARGVKITSVWTPSFNPPTRQQIDDLEGFVDWTGCSLLTYGITCADMRSAFNRILHPDAPCIKVDNSVQGTRRMEGIAAKLLASGPIATKLPPIPENAQYVAISAEPTNEEAIAAAGILVSKLQGKLLHLAAGSMCLFCDHATEELDGLATASVTAKVLIVLLSSGTMQSLSQLVAIVERMRSRELADADSGATIPMALFGFQFPTPDYYRIALPRIFSNRGQDADLHIHAFFRLIAVSLSTHSSDRVLDAEVQQVVALIPTMTRSPTKAFMRRFSMASTTSEVQVRLSSHTADESWGGEYMEDGVQVYRL